MRYRVISPAYRYLSSTTDLSANVGASAIREASVPQSRSGGRIARDGGSVSSAEAIIAAATLICGNPDKAQFWFENEPIADYGNRTAAELVIAGQGPAVLSFLQDLESGALG